MSFEKGLNKPIVCLVALLRRLLLGHHVQLCFYVRIVLCLGQGGDELGEGVVVTGRRRIIHLHLITYVMRRIVDLLGDASDDTVVLVILWHCHIVV